MRIRDKHPESATLLVSVDYLTILKKLRLFRKRKAGWAGAALAEKAGLARLAGDTRRPHLLHPLLTPHLVLRFQDRAFVLQQDEQD
jgi:hypothetical protein